MSTFLFSGQLWETEITHAPPPWPWAASAGAGRAAAAALTEEELRAMRAAWHPDRFLQRFGAVSDGPMLPTKKYHANSFHSSRVNELFSMAPAQWPAANGAQQQSSFKNTREMAYWGRNGVYTQPGSFDESVAPFSPKRHGMLPALSVPSMPIQRELARARELAASRDAFY